jgi:hypothetical protein
MEEPMKKLTVLSVSSLDQALDGSDVNCKSLGEDLAGTAASPGGMFPPERIVRLGGNVVRVSSRAGSRQPGE